MRLASYLVDGQPRAGVVAADQTLVAVSDLIAVGPNDSPQDLPEYPALFSNQPNTVVGPEAPIWHPAPVSDELDWEVELALIVGTPGRDISEAKAYEHVFGYTVGNDVSVRDVQRRHGGRDREDWRSAQYSGDLRRLTCS